MKRMKWMLAMPLVALAVLGCSATQPLQSGAAENENQAAALNTQELHFVGPMDLTIMLKTQDNFESAVMTDNADRAFQMRSVPAASGIRMTDGKGASIHFKNGEGVVELVKDRPIEIKEMKR